MRIQIIRKFIIALFALLAFDLFYLQVIRGGYFYRQSQNNSLRVIPVDGPRGRILDRNGKVLAESIKSYDAAVVPQDIKNRKALFGFLGVVLGKEAAALEKKFNKGRLNPFSPVVVAEGLTRTEAISLSENAALYPGLVVTERYRRKYRRAEHFAHLVGYVGKVAPERMQELINNGISVPESIGYTGVEEAFEEHLRGEPGGKEVEVNSRGREVRVISLREASPGNDITLTVDERIQAVAYQVLGGRRGAFAMMDVETGEILSLVSSPGFDPNAFLSPERRGEVADYLMSSASPMINRAFAASFPPGSTFKIPVAVAGLEEKKIKPNTVFNCPGYFVIGDRRFSFAHAYGDQNLYEAMAHSANEYFFHIGLMVGPEVMANYAQKFGLGERTGIDLPYENKGRLPNRNLRRKWFKGDTANMSIGQGEVLATPLQLARMMGAIETGKLVKPFVMLVKDEGRKTKDEGRNEERSTKDEINRFTSSSLVPRPSSLVTAHPVKLKPETWTAIRDSLRAVVKMNSGTGHPLDLDGIVNYGKTGTAQSAAGKADHAWWAGVVRGKSRAASYCILLEHGGSSHNAVLAAQEILMQIKELL